MEIFAATQNSDQTEGRGHQEVIGWFRTASEAYVACKNAGWPKVNVVDLPDIDDFDEAVERMTVPAQVTIFEYGRWVPEYDPALVDPEWAEYERLAAKFGRATR